MDCNINLQNIELKCDTDNSGGIDSSVYVLNVEDINLIFLNGVIDEVQLENYAEIDVHRLRQSNFTEVAGNSPDSTSTTVAQTVSLSLPPMTAAVRSALKDYTHPLRRFAIVCRMNAKDSGETQYYIAGAHFGLYGSVNSASGTQRSELNEATLTFTGEESVLGYVINEDKLTLL